MSASTSTLEVEATRPAASHALVDFDLYGIVGVRLIDAEPGDVRSVQGQLGAVASPLERDPDIVIRYVDHLKTESVFRHIGMNDAAFTGDAFLVLKSPGAMSARAQIPMDTIGGRCEIICEKGHGPVPLLISIVNLTSLGKGFAPAHASAVEWNGMGIVTTGWTAGGKTGLLLALMSEGARFVGDDVVYISRDGQKICGLQQTIHVKDYYLDGLPKFRSQLTFQERTRLKAFGLIDSFGERLPLFVRRMLGTAKLRDRVARAVRGRRAVHIHPRRLFGESACVSQTRPDKVILVESHDAPQVTIEQADSHEVALRMLYSSQHELMELTSYYLKYRFAFPNRRNEQIERAEQLQRDVLVEALAGKDTYVVRHPYPVSIGELTEAIRPLCKR